MAFKQLEVPGIGTVKLYKRKKSKSIRLRIAHDGTVRVSIPIWAPYSAGLAFLKSKSTWVNNQKTKQLLVIKNNHTVGKAHHIVFEMSNGAQKISTKLKQNMAIITYPDTYNYESVPVQKAAQKMIAKALKKQADALLPLRIRDLSAKTGLSYRSVKTRSLKSRWGSCNQSKDIVLNIYLMQLPWELIDYVILHELTHTRYLHHGKEFWQKMDSLLPNAKTYRKLIKNYRPDGSLDEKPFAL